MNGTEPQETVIQAALDPIAMGQGPSDPAVLADKVSVVSQTPDVQTNATLPAQDSSSTINTTSVPTIEEGGDTTIPSPGMARKQPLPGIRLHDALHDRQACPELNSFHQGVDQISPPERLFSCRPLSKRGQVCYIPAPPNR